MYVMSLCCFRLENDGFANNTPGRQTDPEDFREGILDIALSTDLKAHWLMTTTLDRRFWSIYPCFCDFKIL